MEGTPPLERGAVKRVKNSKDPLFPRGTEGQKKRKNAVIAPRNNSGGDMRLWTQGREKALRQNYRN